MGKMSKRERFVGKMKYIGKKRVDRDGKERKE